MLHNEPESTNMVSTGGPRTETTLHSDDLALGCFLMHFMMILANIVLTVVALETVDLLQNFYNHSPFHTVGKILDSPYLQMNRCNNAPSASLAAQYRR